MNTTQQIIDAFTFRHATKAFDPDKKVSDEDFQTILEAARLSPSSFGYEPWNLVILQNMEIRHELLPYAWGAQGQIPTASHLILLTAKTREALAPDSPHLTHMLNDVHHFRPDSFEKRRTKYAEFLETDFKLLETDRAVWDWAGKQAYIALANMMTAAALLGIDSCPIEGFIADKIEAVLAEEDIVDGVENRLVAMLALGYRAQPPKHARTRRPMNEIVQWVN